MSGCSHEYKIGKLDEQISNLQDERAELVRQASQVLYADGNSVIPCVRDSRSFASKPFIGIDFHASESDVKKVIVFVEMEGSPNKEFIFERPDRDSFSKL